jgi:hypothetical protein
MRACACVRVSVLRLCVLRDDGHGQLQAKQPWSTARPGHPSLSLCRVVSLCLSLQPSAVVLQDECLTTFFYLSPTRNILPFTQVISKLVVLVSTALDGTSTAEQLGPGGEEPRLGHACHHARVGHLCGLTGGSHSVHVVMRALATWQGTDGQDEDGRRR